MKKFFLNLDKVFVINLKKDQVRKNHVVQQLNKVTSNYEIIEAVSYEDRIVKDFYLAGKVVSYPPCFRCLETVCHHENNFLTPKQVANFLSFKKIMENIIEKNLNNVLILEDDFKFNYFSYISFKSLNNFIKKNRLLTLNRPYLFRIGSHTLVNKRYYLKLFLSTKSTFVENNVDDMANPCFLINKNFANIFLKEFNSIKTTSDNFIHRQLVEKYNVLNYSIYPFPIRQLSYGRKNNKFESTITSSKKSSDFIDRNKISSTYEYKKLLNTWLEL